MNQAYKHRPQDFKRRILKTNICSKQDLLKEEYKYLQMIKKEELKIRYYNLHNHKFNHWAYHESSVKTVGQKVSQTKKGISTGPCSEETKAKISAANSGKIRTEEMRKNISESKKGTIQSEETLAKRKSTMNTPEFKSLRSEIMAGKSHPQTEETRAKISSSKKGKESPHKGKTHTEEAKRNMSEGRKGKTGKSIKIDDIEYRSMSVAAKELNLSFRTVQFRVKADTFPNYKFA